MLNLDKKQINVEVNVSQCELSDRLYNALPLEALPRDELARRMQDMRLVKNVMGILSSKCVFSYDGSAEEGNKLRYRIIGEVVNGRWEWSNSSQPLTNIQIKYDVSEKEANIQSFSARMGTGKVQMAYRQWTYEENAPKELRIKVENVPLDDRIAAQFPQNVVDVWKSVQPSGFEGFAYRNVQADKAVCFCKAASAQGRQALSGFEDALRRAARTVRSK